MQTSDLAGEKLNNIPTAHELYTRCETPEDIIEMFKVFAGLHTKRALYIATKTAKTKTELKGKSMGGYTKYVDKEVLDKKSVLNAYPLTNIK